MSETRMIYRSRLIPVDDTEEIHSCILQAWRALEFSEWSTANLQGQVKSERIGNNRQVVARVFKGEF